MLGKRGVMLRMVLTKEMACGCGLAGRNGVIVIMLIEKERESGFLNLAEVRDLHLRRTSKSRPLSKITLTL